MKVNSGNYGPIRPDRARDIAAPNAQPTGQDVKATTARIERLDRVEISDAGRAKSVKVDPVSSDRADRIAEIRRRVLEGAYNADAVVADVARRILDRGDV